MEETEFVISGKIALISCFPPPSILQVLYQAVNYQMEPVNTETGREVDETDSLKVNVIFFPYNPLILFSITCMFLFELPPLSLCGFVSVLFSLCVFLPLHIWWGVNLVLWSSAPLFYLCLPFSSPSALPALWCLEWVLMFHDLHFIPLCVQIGAHLKLSVIILLLYWCPSLVYV